MLEVIGPVSGEMGPAFPPCVPWTSGPSLSLIPSVRPQGLPSGRRESEGLRVQRDLPSIGMPGFLNKQQLIPASPGASRLLVFLPLDGDSPLSMPSNVG